MSDYQVHPPGAVPGPFQAVETCVFGKKIGREGDHHECIDMAIGVMELLDTASGKRFEYPLCGRHARLIARGLGLTVEDKE